MIHQRIKVLGLVMLLCVVAMACEPEIEKLQRLQTDKAVLSLTVLSWERAMRAPNDALVQARIDRGNGFEDRLGVASPRSPHCWRNATLQGYDSEAIEIAFP